MNRDLITPEQASELLGVTSVTLARWADDGQLWVTRTVGGQRRYDREDVKRLVDQLKESK